jgi:hypothetical protein
MVRDRDLSKIDDVLRKYNYKNKSELYKYMMNCSAMLEDGKIIIGSTKHKAGGWEGMHSCDIIISSSSPPEIIGAAVKYAIARCTGKGAYEVAKKLFPDGVPDTFDDYLDSLGLEH